MEVPVRSVDGEERTVYFVIQMRPSKAQARRLKGAAKLTLKVTQESN